MSPTLGIAAMTATGMKREMAANKIRDIFMPIIYPRRLKDSTVIAVEIAILSDLRGVRPKYVRPVRERAVPVCQCK